MRKTITTLLTILVFEPARRRRHRCDASDHQEDRRDQDVRRLGRIGRPLGRAPGHDRRRKTTTITGAKKKVTRKMTAVTVPIYPNHTDRSVFINSNALPLLKSEALRAQSANINLVSGATDTSYGFAQSLQAAILKAKRA